MTERFNVGDRVYSPVTSSYMGGRPFGEGTIVSAHHPRYEIRFDNFPDYESDNDRHTSGNNYFSLTHLKEEKKEKGFAAWIKSREEND